MTILLKEKKIFKSVSYYALTFVKFENGRKNIYYNLNQHTRLKQLAGQHQAQILGRKTRLRKLTASYCETA